MHVNYSSCIVLIRPGTVTPSVVVDSEYTYDRAVQHSRGLPTLVQAVRPARSLAVPPALALTQPPACFHTVLPACLLAVPPTHAPSLFRLGFCSSRTHPRDRWPNVSEVHVSIANLASDGGSPRGVVSTRTGNASCTCRLLHCSCRGATRQHFTCLSR